MASRVCLVHYHEIGLKGKNRARFERILMDNIKAALAAFSVSTITRISGHILVTFSVSGEAERAFEIIRTVPGVARVSLAFHTNREPHEYERAAIPALREFGPFDSFKVVAKRSNTDYELSSMDLNRQVGEVLCEAFPDKKVLMKGCDAQVHVLVVQGSVYVYARSERGVGGLPKAAPARSCPFSLPASIPPSQVGSWRGAEPWWCLSISPDAPRPPIPASISVGISSRPWVLVFRSVACTSFRSAIASARYRSPARAIFASSCTAV